MSRDRRLDCLHSLKINGFQTGSGIMVGSPYQTLDHVVEDLLRLLDAMAPWKNPAYTHAGGNTAAHMKTSLIGSSAQVIVAYGNVQLGMWQGLYLCEFDGPRIRHVWVQ